MQISSYYAINSLADFDNKQKFTDTFSHEVDISTSEGEKKIPEWHFFDRLNELEKIALELMEKTDTTEPSLKNATIRATDASIVALFALGSTFMVTASDVSNPRALKDRYINALEQSGLSQRMLGIAKRFLIKMCELIEKGGTSK